MKKVVIPDKIGQFKRFLNKPTTMKYGTYYCMEFDLPFSKENKRMVRVWLPEEYEFDNPNKRFPVIYMSDGQNLVDRYLSAFGEWEFDKVCHKLNKDIIAVGIDCPKEPLERTKELCPPYIPRKEILDTLGDFKNPHVDKYIDYIIYNIKPIIDNLFYTLSDREHTCIGGSSMGGIMSFFAYIYRPEVFGLCLSFSPAFFFYETEEWRKILDKYDINPNKNGRVFFYVGGKGFESEFTEPTIWTHHYLQNKSFKDNQLALVVDLKQEHHEKAWAKYLPEALEFFLVLE